MVAGGGSPSAAFAKAKRRQLPAPLLVAGCCVALAVALPFHPRVAWLVMLSFPLFASRDRELPRLLSPELVGQLPGVTPSKALSPWLRAGQDAGLAFLILLISLGVLAIGVGLVDKPWWAFTGEWAGSTSILLGCAGAAFLEEWFFRGFLQERLALYFQARRQWRVLGASFGWELPLTALLFCLFHLGRAPLALLPFWLFPALVFGWCQSRTRAVLCGSLVHWGYNLWATGFDQI